MPRPSRPDIGDPPNIPQLAEGQKYPSVDQIKDSNDANARLFQEAFYIDAILTKFDECFSTFDNKLVVLGEENRAKVEAFLAERRTFLQSYFGNFEYQYETQFEDQGISFDGADVNMPFTVGLTEKAQMRLMEGLYHEVQVIQELARFLNYLDMLSSREANHIKVKAGIYSRGQDATAQMNVLYAQFGQLIDQPVEERFSFEDDVNIEAELTAMKTLFEAVETNVVQKGDFSVIMRTLRELEEKRSSELDKYRGRQKREASARTKLDAARTDLMAFIEAYPSEEAQFPQIEKGENRELELGVQASLPSLIPQIAEMSAMQQSGSLKVYDPIRARQLAVQERENKQNQRLEAARSFVGSRRNQVLAALLAVAAAVPFVKSWQDERELDDTKAKVAAYLKGKARIPTGAVVTDMEFIAAAEDKLDLFGRSVFLIDDLDVDLNEKRMAMVGYSEDLKRIKDLVYPELDIDEDMGLVIPRDPKRSYVADRRMHLPLDMFCEGGAKEISLRVGEEQHTFPVNSEEVDRHCINLNAAAQDMRRRMKARFNKPQFGEHIDEQGRRIVTLPSPNPKKSSFTEAKSQVQGFFSYMKSQGVIPENQPLADLDKIDSFLDLEMELFRVMGPAAIEVTEKDGRLHFAASSYINSVLQSMYGQTAKAGVATAGQLKAYGIIPSASSLGFPKDLYCSGGQTVGIVVEPDFRDKKKRRFQGIDNDPIRQKFCGTKT